VPARPGLLLHLGDQPGYRRQPLLQDVRAGHPRPARGGQQRAVRRDQRHVGLAVPAVDGEDLGEGQAHG